MVQHVFHLEDHPTSIAYDIEGISQKEHTRKARISLCNRR